MFSLFGKKKKEATLASPANGELVLLETVSDPVFAQKVMGDGYAVIPADGNIVMPADGTVTSIFPTKHAIGLLLENGLELLVHMGVETVALKGAPFEIFVEENQKVKAGDALAKMDLELLAKEEKDHTIMLILTNGDEVASFEVNAPGTVSAGEEIGKAVKK
ncbi:PTS sugar transporter subunit IIA [Isobaculum melis]|uniref:PTS system IIA component, Glc family n=1 Tax=Isobaculum melis TaxID=142588 RepID=A0A1H9TCX9_9LACT|nr:glucose PTS transporter subunit IIA [Isobaculum melis]SER94966.1 PTS system IIA component, Glc family [Isobaculum melis]